MISISDVAAQMNICKVMAIALPIFYKRTGLNAQFSFVYKDDGQGMQLSIGFTPRDATEKEYSILFEELFDAEKILMNEYIVNNAPNFETIQQLIFKHKEEMREIIEKHKKGYK